MPHSIDTGGRVTETCDLASSSTGGAWKSNSNSLSISSGVER